MNTEKTWVISWKVTGSVEICAISKEQAAEQFLVMPDPEVFASRDSAFEIEIEEQD